ncbi:hypothetical protein BV22DRAFT_1104339 [Leucogyrophana mollusca]|uniref:Uncharacterized protein n=1 Tax=Leucogyrophana mollusca TaxID=85980 RepID=A0ACB8BL25_9AGAM|nr:hypothetical protein BV22DRAFT_1104339 [Leucogyrophana mollusca]
MSFCQDCVRGVRHGGTPEGKIETIGGITCYVGTPAGDYPKDKVILYIADAFGIDLFNTEYASTLLLVDDFARNGFKVVAPDHLHGDPIPADIIPLDAVDPRVSPSAAIDSGTSTHLLLYRNIDIGAWAVNHGPNQTRPILDAVVAALKEEGVTLFGATRYCFGVSVVAHPSILKAPDDIEVNQKVHTHSIQNELLGDGKFAPGYARAHWEGCTHGFAVRGDLSNPLVKAGKEDAFSKSIEFFKKHL